MSSKRKFPAENTQKPPAENTVKPSTKSWKAVTKAEEYFLEGRYGKALPLLFKYEDCEARAMMFLAYMYFEGVGCVQNMERGVSYLQKLVHFDGIREGEEGVLAIALFYMAELYYKGLVVTTDQKQAESLWLRGATLPKDPETGMHHYGSMECQTALGMYYSSPDVQDFEKAFHWHKLAQESGSLVSEGALGVMYFYGIGVDKNLELSYNHLTSAAFQGYSYAKGYLAVYCYQRGMYHKVIILGKELAAEKDLETAAKSQGCPVDHVKRGIAIGCYYFALCCQYGYSVPKDKNFAVELIKKAIDLSPEVANDIHTKAILCIA